MTGFRALLLRHPVLALMLFVAALAMKALVPSGMMIDAGSRVLSVRICADGLGTPSLQRIVVPMEQQAPDAPADSGHGDGAACAYGTGLAKLALADGPVMVLPAPQLFPALETARLTPLPLIARAGQWRPPLRGPPQHLPAAA